MVDIILGRTKNALTLVNIITIGGSKAKAMFEPSTLLLLASGLVGLAAVRRKRDA